MFLKKDTKVKATIETQQVDNTGFFNLPGVVSNNQQDEVDHGGVLALTKTEIVQEIDNIKDQLIEKYHPEKIILFGSAAWGSSNEVNDLDFFIVKKDVPYYGSDRIGELYRLMDTHSAVDYIVYKPEEVEKWLSLGDPFLKKIFAEGKVLYG